MATSNLVLPEHENMSDRLKQTWLDLINHISATQLAEIQQSFESGPSDGLNKSQLTKAIEETLNCNCSEQSIDLFERIDLDLQERVTWKQFLDFLVANLVPSQSKGVDLQVKTIISVPQTKRESIVKVVSLETEKYFCYAIITKHGRVGLYDGNLNFLTTYQLIMTREDISRREEHRRRRNRWVTDAIFLRDVQMFVVTNTARSIVFYEASSLKHVPLFLVLSTPNVVECFAYKNTEDASNECVLFMGDDSGFLYSFSFKQPKTSLLRKKHNDKISLFYWDELPLEKEFVSINRAVRLHQENVKQLKYFGHNDCLISCSKDFNSSLVAKHKGHKQRPHVFKMPKGCNCFDLSRKHKILVTGSDDRVLRLWNPIITSKPIGIMKGHRATIVDVKIIDQRSVIMSCSSDACVKLWQVHEEKCIQSLTIAFPSFTIFGKAIEWGIECLYPGPKCVETQEVWSRSPILVTCCNHIALITTGPQSDVQILPPPPLQNSVLVPNTWTTSENGEKINDSLQIGQVDELDPAILEKRFTELEFILNKDLFANSNSSRSDINFKIATLEARKLQMQKHVARGAPYLALELHQVNSLTLSPNLPTFNKKKIKNIAGQIVQMLDDASSRDLIFSEECSSRSPRSSRSSIVEFDY